MFIDVETFEIEASQNSTRCGLSLLYIAIEDRYFII